MSGEQAAKRVRRDGQQQQQQANGVRQQAVPPWESDDHRKAVEQPTPLQVCEQICTLDK